MRKESLIVIVNLFFYVLFGFTMTIASFGVVRAAWNTPVGPGTPLNVQTWNDRDNKITELESRMNILYNMLPGTVCGVESGGDNCTDLARLCRPASPPPGLLEYGGDMNNGGNCVLRVSVVP